MPVVITILGLMLKFSWVLFLVALAGSFGGQYLARQGKLRQARWAVMAGFGAASLLAVLYLTTSFLGRGALDLLFAAIWGWFAWRDYKVLQAMPKA